MNYDKLDQFLGTIQNENREHHFQFHFGEPNCITVAKIIIKLALQITQFSVLMDPKQIMSVTRVVCE
jgi:hypothetical protein